MQLRDCRLVILRLIINGGATHFFSFNICIFPSSIVSFIFIHTSEKDHFFSSPHPFTQTMASTGEDRPAPYAISNTQLVQTPC